MKAHGLAIIAPFIVLVLLGSRPSDGEIGNLLEVSKSFRQSFSTVNSSAKWYWVREMESYYTCESDAYLVTDKLDTARIREVTVEVKYEIQSDPKGSKPTNASNFLLIVSTAVNTSIRSVVGTLNTTDNTRQATSLVRMNARTARFGLRRPNSRSCLRVYRVKITYRYCPKQSFSYGLVQFPRTHSPPNGSAALAVVGRCTTSSNRPRAYCESTGNWSYNETVPCRCRSGQIATGIGCFDLSRIVYNVKATRLSNSEAVISWTTPDIVIPYKVKCWKCFSHWCGHNCSRFQFTPSRNDSRAKNGGSISGLDDTARYVLLVVPTMDGLNESEYEKTWGKNVTLEVLPSKVENLTLTKNASQRIILTWLPPTNWLNVSYKVTCDVSCSHGNCSTGCDHLTYVPSSDNLLGTRVTVEGFRRTGNQYIFKVMTMNRWQNGSEGRLVKWNYDAISYIDEPKVEILNKDKTFNIFDVVIGVSVLILAVIIAVVVTKCYNKRRARKSSLNLDCENMENAYNCEARLTTSPSTHYVDPANYESMKNLLRQFNKKLNEKFLKIDEMIGEGEFGMVWKGCLDLPGKEQTIVAVKCLRCGLSPKLRRDFLAEASVMGQFNDPNIVSLHGVVVKRTTVKIVMEYMSNGSLDAYLLKNSGGLTTLQLLGMARGIASGMKYLSGRNFIHRDLAARNILVDENLCCKVSDFGLTREICKTSNYETRGGKIPIRWTAPEVIKYKKSFIASDVWSYGVVLWEIMAFGQRPYWKWDNFQVLQEIESGYRLPAPLKCPKSVHSLMLDCWKRERTERPLFSCIVDRLDEWIRSPETINNSPSLTLNRNNIENSQCPIQEWLTSIKMGKYTSNFLDAGYTELCQVAGLTEEDLLNMGIKLVGHRHKIHQSIPLVVDCDENNDVFLAEQA